jgi:hypothetical protein
MPFSSHKGSVTGCFEHLRDSYAVLVKVPLIGRNTKVIDHVPDTRLLRIQSGEEGGT